MSLTSINTPKMVEYVKETWLDPKAVVTLPPKMSVKSLPNSWKTVENDDICIIKHQFHPDPIQPISEEWEVIVHKTFKFGVVKNQHGFYMEQLAYK